MGTRQLGGQEQCILTMMLHSLNLSPPLLKYFII